MTPYTANPFVYIFSVVLIGAVLLYFLYGAIDRTGLEKRAAVGTVMSKHYTPPGTSYYQTESGGRSWVQSQRTPEIYSVAVKVGTEPTSAAVSKDLYARLQVNDTVQVTIQRTRISGKLLVVDLQP